jgi:hypothetical protein
MCHVILTLFAISNLKCEVDFSDFWSKAKSDTACRDVDTLSHTDVRVWVLNSSLIHFYFAVIIFVLLQMLRNSWAADFELPIFLSRIPAR